MRGTCSPVSDTPRLIGGCRHDHNLRSDAGVRHSTIGNAVLGVEVGAVLVLADTCFDNAVRSLLHCNSACEVDLRDSLLDHAVVVLDVNPCLREKRSVDLSCLLVDEPVHHSELRLRIQQVLTALELYIFFCHVVFLFYIGLWIRSVRSVWSASELITNVPRQSELLLEADVSPMMPMIA